MIGGSQLVTDGGGGLALLTWQEMLKPDTIVRSVDLQKVVMLPRLPGLKNVCFTRRLVGSNHTFAPVSSNTTLNEVESVV